MPLTFADLNKENIIKKVGGGNETKRHLENLGFVPGSSVSIITKNNGNLIVNIKDSRVAISEELAKKIMIKGSQSWRYSDCQEVKWSRCNKTKNYGYGYN